jgi:hypothetical protein
MTRERWWSGWQLHCSGFRSDGRHAIADISGDPARGFLIDVSVGCETPHKSGSGHPRVRRVAFRRTARAATALAERWTA